MTDFDQEITEAKAVIDSMSLVEMARVWRFSHVGHPYFDRRTPVCDYFLERFQRLGGWSAELSKQVGWDFPAVHSDSSSALVMSTHFQVHWWSAKQECWMIDPDRYGTVEDAEVGAKKAKNSDLFHVAEKTRIVRVETICWFLNPEEKHEPTPETK